MLLLKYNFILPSSAPVERMFSIATNVNKPLRNKLNDTNFILLVLLKANSLYYIILLLILLYHISTFRK